MPKNKQRTVKVFREVNSISFHTAAGNNGINCVIKDIKTLLESLASQGEEVKISKASLRIVMSIDTVNTNDSPLFMTIVGMVSDAAIASAAPAANAGILDDDLDVFTSGDYEFKELGVVHSQPRTISTGVTLGEVKGTIDITSFCQRSSSLLARSAILSTNPYISIVGTGGLANNNNRPPRFGYSVLRMEYVLAQKPLRMLT